MTYEQFRWLIDGLSVSEPQHAQRFYTEMSTFFVERFAASVMTEMPSREEMQRALASFKDAARRVQERTRELDERETTIQQQQADATRLTRQLMEQAVLAVGFKGKV